MFIKLTLVKMMLSLNAAMYVKDLPNKPDPCIYQVVKVQSYAGRNLEAAYKINYKNKATHETRFFEVIKTNGYIKNYFLADYLLVEKSANSVRLIFYPTGWASLKFVKESELKETCALIVRGEIPQEPMPVQK